MTPAPSPASAPVPSRARAADRSELEAEYLRLVRDDLPALAGAGGWIVRNDHCFGRILLDAQSRQWRGKPRRGGALDMSGGSLR